MLNTFRQMGGSLKIAIFGAVLDVGVTSAHGPRVSHVAAAVLILVTAAATITLREPARRRGSTS